MLTPYPFMPFGYKGIRSFWTCVDTYGLDGSIKQHTEQLTVAYCLSFQNYPYFGTINGSLSVGLNVIIGGSQFFYNEIIKVYVHLVRVNDFTNQ